MRHLYASLARAARWAVGTATLIGLVMAVVALQHRRCAEHGTWMIRAYALGMGAGTQVFTHLPWFLLVGKPHGLVRDTLMAAGWLTNACVAEWVVRRRKSYLKVPRRRIDRSVLFAGPRLSFRADEANETNDESFHT
jgi:hypothetical protein